MVVLPDGVLLTGINTPERFMQVLKAHCDTDVSEADVEAATLRMKGNDAARSGRLNLAVDLYTQALDLRPPHGMHLLYANRSGARLSMGDADGAVDDAQEALRHAPPSFSTAVVRLVDALYACKDYEQALRVLREVPQATQPAFVRSAEYATLKAAIEAAAHHAAL